MLKDRCITCSCIACAALVTIACTRVLYNKSRVTHICFQRTCMSDLCLNPQPNFCCVAVMLNSCFHTGGPSNTRGCRAFASTSTSHSSPRRIWSRSFQASARSAGSWLAGAGRSGRAAATAAEQSCRPHVSGLHGQPGPPCRGGSASPPRPPRTAATMNPHWCVNLAQKCAVTVPSLASACRLGRTVYQVWKQCHSRYWQVACIQR